LKNTTGVDNSAFGYEALLNNTFGSENTAIGFSALETNSASANTAIGYNALFNNTGGEHNTATGVEALYFNYFGFGNTATGENALFSNYDGSDNTATGTNALFNNGSDYNTATGSGALFYNTGGADNTASGYLALNNSGRAMTPGAENRQNVYAGISMSAVDRPWLKPHHFPPGKSGNPRGGRSDKKLVATVLRETRDLRELAQILLKIARTATRPRDRIEACRVLLDRVLGKPSEHIEIERQDAGRAGLAERNLVVAVLEEQLREVNQAASVAAQPVIEIEAQPVEAERVGVADRDAALQ
jgi:hypothetical protein